MNAPGSPSSALQMTYLGQRWVCRASFHLVPVENPPPPRPRSPDRIISSMTCSGVMVASTFSNAE